MMELIEDDEQNNQEDVGALTPGNSKDKPNSVPKKSQPKSKQRNRRETPLWKFVSTGEDTARVMPEWLGELELSENVKRPIEYFEDFFSSDILLHIVDQTNLYALQENPNKPLKLNVNELEQFIGTLLAMYIVKLSNSRLYWSNNLQCEMVTEAFSRDRWEQIKSNLHCNDNSQAPKYGDPNYDKLYKIRPLINHLQSKFRKIPMPQMLCVDEQFVLSKENLL
nr:piggyBac transposable element-derived protein 1-like isoform X1 [Lepeophtheirus salmonis]